jgi:hypothetical protein
MSLYYFDTDNGDLRFRDEEGTECADDRAACDEASRAMAELAKEFIPGAGPQKNVIMWVRRDDGTIILQLTLAFEIQSLTRPDATVRSPWSSPRTGGIGA